MKKTLLTAATLLALGLAAPATAHDTHDCADVACTQHWLYEGAGDSGGGDTTVATRYGTWGIDTAGMDRSVAPGADFFGFANGTWAKNTPIPADQSSYGSFRVLRDLSEARVRALVEGHALGDPATGGDSAKIAAVYRGFMDEAAIEKLGAAPLQPALARIRQADTHAELAALMGARDTFNVTLFGLGVSDDQRDPDRYTLYMNQSGLGLGDREMYLRDTFAPQRERYLAYIAQMLELGGWNDPKGSAQAVMALETRIAEAHWTRAESRDRDMTYNPVAFDGFDAYAPGVPWSTYFAAAGVDHGDRAVVRQSTAIPKLAKIFADTDVATLQAWQAFHAIDGAAPLLSSAFANAHFEFRDKFLSGQLEQRERWKRAVALVESTIGEAVGRDYVKLYFPPEAKAKMDELVANGDVVGNALRSRAFEWDYRRARLGQPVDKAEWGMTPQTVNAYYNSVKNEIVFPAAILQPPFFDPDADPAVNYGGIGGVIGHEIVHGFDDQGRKSDGKGVLRDWWTAEDAAKFEVQAARLGAQYEAYAFPQLPGMRINGRVAMGENIGDLGGLTIALEAYPRSLDGKPAPVIDGFTGDQRFFMGWGQVWRTLWRDDALRQQLVNGTHSPGHIRAFAPLRNIDAWYDAFDVKPGDALYIAPQDRVRIW